MMGFGAPGVRVDGPVASVVTENNHLGECFLAWVVHCDLLQVKQAVQQKSNPPSPWPSPHFPFMVSNKFYVLQFAHPPT